MRLSVITETNYLGKTIHSNEKMSEYLPYFTQLINFLRFISKFPLMAGILSYCLLLINYLNNQNQNKIQFLKMLLSFYFDY